MRVMVIVKADKNSEAGELPDSKMLEEMGNFNEELMKAGVMLAGEGLQDSSKGKRVRFMYREAPDNEIDSGWRFLSGSESDEYMNDASKHGVYDVNTIANYDPDIVPFLNAPVGAAYERPEGDVFVKVDFSPPQNTLH